MKLTIEEEMICSQYMNIGGKNRCDDCPLNFGDGECYATIDGRGLDIKRYNSIPENVIQGVKDIANYAGITMHQMVYNRDKIGLPYYSTGKKFFAFREELDAWKERQ